MVDSLLISEAFELYRLEHIVYLNQSRKTEEMSIGAMKALIAFTGDIPVTELSFDLIRKWKEHLDKTRGQNTVRGYIIKLRVVLKHLIVRGHKGIVHPDMIGVPRRKNTVVEFLSPEDVNRLIEFAFMPLSGYSKVNRYKNRAIISLLYASGIRVSELCSLNRASLHMDDLSFTVMGKGNKPRLCFFDERTKGYIQAYLEYRDDNHPSLFLSKIEDRITAGVVQMIFRAVSKRAGFDSQIHPHTLRHSFATNLLKNNTNLIYVRDFLGHSSVQTTEMYTHVVQEDLRAIYLNKHTI